MNFTLAGETKVRRNQQPIKPEESNKYAISAWKLNATKTFRNLTFFEFYYPHDDKKHAQKLTMLEASFEKQFNNYIAWKILLVVGIAVFILSALLHLGSLFALHCTKNFTNFNPSLTSLINKKSLSNQSLWRKTNTCIVFKLTKTMNGAVKISY